MESKLPEEIKEQIEKEGRAYAKSFGRKEIGYYSLNFIAGATEWAQWKVKYDELVQENARLKAKCVNLITAMKEVAGRFSEGNDLYTRELYNILVNAFLTNMESTEALKEGESNTPDPVQGEKEADNG